MGWVQASVLQARSNTPGRPPAAQVARAIPSFPPTHHRPAGRSRVRPSLARRPHPNPGLLARPTASADPCHCNRSTPNTCALIRQGSPMQPTTITPPFAVKLHRTPPLSPQPPTSPLVHPAAGPNRSPLPSPPLLPAGPNAKQRLYPEPVCRYPPTRFVAPPRVV